MEEKFKFNFYYRINSENSKTGRLTNTYRKVGDTCPDTCPFLKNGKCYAMKGPTRIWGNKSIETVNDIEKMFKEVREKGIFKIIRLHVSGDFFKINNITGKKEVDKDYINALIEVSKKYPDITVYTYTHEIEEIVKAGFTKDKFSKNFVLIASVHSKKEGKRIKEKYNFKYARVQKLDENIKLDKNEKYCPVDYFKSRGQKLRAKQIQCVYCKLCFKSKYDIVFMEV